MTRSMLTTFLCALILAVGLYAALRQSENHARARVLAECQRLCEMIEAANEEAEARALAHLPGEGALERARDQRSLQPVLRP
jgi:hypothetical protein